MQVDDDDTENHCDDTNYDCVFDNNEINIIVMILVRGSHDHHVQDRHHTHHRRHNYHDDHNNHDDHHCNLLNIYYHNHDNHDDHHCIVICSSYIMIIMIIFIICSS